MTETIPLTDDIHQDEPLAWMVLLHDTTTVEYRVFIQRWQAVRCAEQQQEASGLDWLIYPLYATRGEAP